MRGRPFYLPLHLDLGGKTCLFVGAGKINERRVLSVLPTGARVVVVAPSATPRIVALAEEGRLEWHRRSFVSGDLRGVSLVFVAIDGDPTSVVKAAREKGVMVNLASAGTEGDFIVPSVVREGEVVLSVSTSGRDPGLTKRLARWLKKELSRWLTEVKGSEE